jgi:hypothetical protein
MKIAEYLGQDSIQLPIPFRNRDFLQTLRSFFNKYNSIVESISKLDDPRFHLSDEDKGKLELIEKKILEAIDAYFNGFPAKAYRLVSEGIDATSGEFGNFSSIKKIGESLHVKQLYRLRK